MNEKVTIKDIAELAGVSIATVSRVLNQNGRFSKETEKKVHDVINKFHYRTNIVAKSLRTNQSKTIGLIVPDITNEFFSQIVLAIEEFCYPRGYTVFVCNTNENEEKEAIQVRDLLAKGVDGIIHLGGKTFTQNKQQIPMVCIDRSSSSTQSPVITSDNCQGGMIATEHLIGKGCKRILLLKDNREVSPMIERFKGYLKAFKKHHIPVYDELIVNVEVNVERARQKIQKIIEKGVVFDGIFASTDWLAIGAQTALYETGRKVPDDVKIVGFDDITIGKYLTPKLTTIQQDKRKMGQLAIEILMKLIEKPNQHQDRIIVPVHLIERETT